MVVALLLRTLTVVSMRGLIILMVGFAPFASAVEFKYYKYRDNWDGVHYSSSDAACAAAYKTNTFWDYDYAAEPNDPKGKRCYAKSKDTGQSGSHFWWIEVVVSCPPDHIYNYETKQCEPKPDECKQKKGQAVSWNSSGIEFEACIAGCIAALTSSDFADPGSRRAFKPGVTEQVLFHNRGFYTGESCGSSSADAADGDVPPTESSSDDDCTATVTDAEGRKISSCTKTDIFKDQRDCVQSGGSLGNVNGMMTCVKSKGPKATQSTTETTVSTEKGPSGDTKTTTTTTTTTKNCVGTGACSSTTTTVTNTNITNADGSKGSSSTGCTGDNCGSGNSGAGNGQGSGKGDSNGNSDDGEGEEDQEEEGIDGPSGSLTQGELGNFAEGIAEWEQRLTEVRSELDTKVEQLSGQFHGVFDLDLGGGSGALPCETFPVSFGQRSTTLRLCPADYADQLSYLRYALLLAATALGAIIILRG